MPSTRGLAPLAIAMSLAVACQVAATVSPTPSATSPPLPATARPTDAPTATPTSLPTFAPTPEPSPYVDLYLGLLRSIPDTPETRSRVVVNNYQLVRETFGIAVPGPGADPEALVRYVRETALPGPLISGYSQYLSPSWDNRQTLGFDMRDVDQSVQAGELEVVKGSIYPTATRQAIESCAECPPPDLKKHGSVAYFSWGEDFRQNLPLRHQPPAFDHLGRGGRLAFLNGYAFRSLSTGGMEGIIDAHQGEAPSLSTDADLQLAVRILAQPDPPVFTFFVSDLERDVAFYQEAKQPEVRDWDSLSPAVKMLVDPRTATFEQELADVPPLLPYRTLAVGRGRDGQGCYLRAALLHDSATAAEANRARLARRLRETSNLYYLRLGDAPPRPWPELLETVELGVEGSTTWARLRFVPGEPPEQSIFSFPLFDCAGGILTDEEFRRDPLFMHE